MEKSLIETFANLVEIDSPSGHEGKIVKHTSDLLRGLGLFVSVDSYGNIFAKTEGKGEPLVLSAHLDTVEPGRNIDLITEGGVIQSSGETILGADNKAFVAAIIDAIKNVKNVRNLEIVFSVREETNGGINDFDFTPLKGKFGILADSGEPIGTIIAKSPWIEEFEVEILGKTAHSSVPKDGVNALKITADVISKIKVGNVDSQTTMNIGMINGGHVVNTIPGIIRLKGELRSYSKNKFIRYSQKIEDKFVRGARKRKGAINFRRSLYSEGFEIKRSEIIFEHLLSIYNNLGVKPLFKKSLGGSDANTFFRNGIKLLNIGDGVQCVHTSDEKIKIADLKKLRDIVAAFISG